MRGRLAEDATLLDEKVRKVRWRSEKTGEEKVGEGRECEADRAATAVRGTCGHHQSRAAADDDVGLRGGRDVDCDCWRRWGG